MPLAPVLARRLKIAALAATVLVLVYGIAAGFGIPAALRWALEGPVSKELGRSVRAETVRVNPFTLHATVSGLAIAPGTNESQPLAEVRELSVELAWTSLLHLAPVIDRLTVTGLRTNLVRTAPQRFNVSDIVERILAKPASPDPTHFAIYNIEITDSTIAFDDQVRHSTETITDIAVGIPFISNFPSDRKVQVQPRLAANINGKPFALVGEALPFAQSLDTVLKFKFDRFDLPHLLSFSPVPLNFDLRQGQLGADLTLTFRRATAAQGEIAAQPERLILAGTTWIDDFALAAPAGQAAKPLLGFKKLEVRLEELGLLIHRAKVAEIQLQAPSVELVRTARGFNWAEFAAQPLLADPASPAREADQPTTQATAATPWSWSLDKLTVRQGHVHFVDETLGRFERQANAIEVELTGLASDAAQPAKLALSLTSPEQESLKLDGEIGVAPLAGRIGFEAQGTQLRTAARYLAQVIDASIDGRSDLSGTLDFAQQPTGFEIALRDLKVAGHGLRVRGPSGSGATLDINTLAIDGGRIDLQERSVEFERVAIDAPRATVTRLANGEIGWLKVIRPSNTPPGADPEAPWKIRVGAAELKRGELRLEDLATQPAAKIRLTGLELKAKNLAPGTATRSDLNLRAYLGRGWVVAGGWISLAPVNSRMWVDARNLNLASLRPYFGQYLNAVVASAEASARGNFEFALPTDAPPRFGYSGNARLSNLHVLDADGETDLLRWQALEVDKIRLRSGSPLKLEVGQVVLSDFYARAILSAQGKLNLTDVLKRETPAAAHSTEPAAPAPTAELPAAPAIPAAPRPEIAVGGIVLTRGNINFTDNFIKPNYTANITGLTGTITAVSSDDSAVPADVDLNGKIDDQAPVTIAGTINPLARELTLDLRGAADGIDLPSFTPYSVKYAGYPITKGKLSVKVNYQIVDGQLTANNNIVLDQLTFGERVDSPDATKLPVLLAVSLLKNRDGNIDIDLPISGSINDPQFSVGGIIFRAVVNLLVKAVTSPFSLLASAFGGGGEELGYVSFAAGSSALSPAQQTKLDTLSRALLDRPALKLDVIGRVDPASDIDGLKTAKLDARLRAVQVKERVRAGESVDPTLVTITAAERPQLMATVYNDTSLPDKPRNFLGLAKAVPMAEQEALLLANIKITPADLRTLANQRASAVSAYLEAKDQVPRERIFIVEPKLNADGIKDGAPAPRVDFELK
ncbi:MAG: DUF748 domain-containing protein [Burkholderiaceae bacterium]